MENVYIVKHNRIIKTAIKIITIGLTMACPAIQLTYQ